MGAAPAGCAAARILRALGVTRLGLLTGLDRLGLPVAQAVRPLARTIGVHSGKGFDEHAAFRSALGEAAEYAALERFDRVDAEGPAAAAPDRRFVGGEGPADLPLQWVRAEALAGAPFLVPLAQVRMDFTAAHPLPVSSNGNASGETRAAALLAGLLEVIERDAIAAWLGQDPLARGLAAFAPDGCAEPHVRALLARARAAGIGVRFHALANAAGVPVVACQLLELRPDRIAGRVAVGTAARPTLAEAIRDSLAEAAQVRLTRIAGAREDLPTPAAEDADNGFGAHLPLPPGLAGKGLARAGFRECERADPLAWTVERVVAAGFPELGHVGMGVPGCPLAVVKVVVPGMRDMPPPAGPGAGP